MATFQDGPWFTFFLPGDHLDTGSTQRIVDTTLSTPIDQWPDRVCDANLPPSQRAAQRWFNTSCFAVPAGLVYGNAGRSSVQGPGIVNVDLALHKEFHVTEQQRIQFRAEAFDSLNHPNFTLPGQQFGTDNFGIVGAALAPCQIQCALKYTF
jgi:hypothetical protein